MKQHETAKIFCPTCGILLNGASNTDEEDSVPPSDGDVSLCFYCCHVGVFSGTPIDKIVSPSQAHLDELLDHPEVKAVLATVRAMHAVEGVEPPPTNQRHSRDM